MSRFAEGVLVACLLGSTATTEAQTIADYSRSQRAAIDATIARQGGRAPTLPTLAPAPPVPLPTLAVPAAASAAPARSAAPPAERDGPLVSVSGAFLSSSQGLAEVQVDGVAYMLPAGEAVPGTDWVVDRIQADRVVLVKARGGRSGRPLASRSFTLAAVRP